MKKQNTMTAKEGLRHLVDAGEGERVEFKASLRWNRLRKRPDKNLQSVVVKTLAGFLNGSGGTLLIGIDDAGTAVGIADDIKSLSPKRQNRDGFELHFWNLIVGAIGEASTTYLVVTFHEVDGEEICQVTAEPSNHPIYLKESQDHETLYLRTGNSTRALPLSEAVKYVRLRWGEKETMGTTRHDHDFNWAKAKRECSLSVEALKLRDSVRAQVEEIKKDNPRIQFKELSESHFRVCRCIPAWGPDRCVHFQVKPNRVVISYLALTNRSGPVSEFNVTTTLNDQAECRYQINGSGEYLRWQIVETALKELFSE